MNDMTPDPGFGTRPGDLEWLGTHYRVLIPTAATGGGISVVDSWSPAGSGPPRHVHDDADETFVILTGEAVFWLEGECFRAGPGEAVHIPKGREHTFRVTDDGPSRHLLILTPGGFEGFFADMAKGRFAIPDDMPAVEESAARHSLRFTGPPLGPDDGPAEGAA